MLTDPVNLTSPAELAALLRRHAFRPRKRLGQHFLIDRNTLDRVVEAGDLTERDQVLEIGAGAGVLTRALAQKAGRVVSIETDEYLEPILAETLARAANVELVMGDALELDLGQWLGRGRWKVVANLPYYITSPLIAGLLEFRKHLTRLILMMQIEVADRLLSPPGRKEYGSLSVFVQTYCTGTRVMKVSKNSFHPRPEVDSAVVSLEVRERPVISEELAPLFFQLVHAAFEKRRKTLRNALSSLEGVAEKDLMVALAESGIDPGRRGETLSPEHFATLAGAVSRRGGAA